MKNIYGHYLEAKKHNSKKLYLFEKGIFYIFLAEDAKYINTITTLELTEFNKNIVKCGFPKKSLEKYLNIFNNLKLDVEVFNDVKDNNHALDEFNEMIKKLDINEIKPTEALNYLVKYWELIKDE